MVTNRKANICMKSLLNWTYPKSKILTYSWITDDQIKESINSADLDKVDLNAPWDQETTSTEHPLHIGRVAKMVESYISGTNQSIYPITIIASKEINNGGVGCCVSDGQHTLRALTYLQKKSVHADIEGIEAEIDKLECE